MENHVPSIQTSVQLWLPRLSCQAAVPAKRAGIPTERNASTKRMDNPVQEAMPCLIDSAGLWLVFSRSVLYSTPTTSGIIRFIVSMSARMSVHLATRGAKRL